jgi:hypothetical protein
VEVPGASVSFDAFFGSRRRAVKHLGPELLPIFLVLHPPSLSRKPFSCTDGCQGANQRYQIAVAFGFDLEHGPTFSLWKVTRSISPERLSGNMVDAFCTGQIIY